jgi:hypothetical protein
MGAEASPTPRVDAALIEQAHRLYVELTGQTLRLDYVRQRQWYELLHAGHTLEEVRSLILYLQREIRAGRRNVGALKLSNLLQPDRFEEDLQIRRLRLEPPRPSATATRTSAAPCLTPAQREQGRRHALERLRQLKVALH